MRSPALVTVLGCATVAAVAVSHSTVLRSVFGLPFLLFGQGYVLTRALWPEDFPGISARLCLALAFSITETIGASLLLDILSIRFTGASSAVAALIVTAAASVVAIRRQPVMPKPSNPDRSWRVPGVRPWLASLALALVIVAAALAVLARPLPNDTVAGYTQLWALRGSNQTITVGLQSAELRTEHFRVVAHAPGGSSVAFTGSLAPGGIDTRSLRLPGPPLQTVVVTMYAAPGSQPLGQIPYRTVWLKA
jgi:hypothetical protein